MRKFSWILGLGVIVACNGAKTDEIKQGLNDEIVEQLSFRNYPISAVKPELQEFFYLGKAENYISENGSIIEVPENAFGIDPSGQDTVIISFQSFLTPADVILSGIKMEYDTVDSSYPFQTAGMFEIRANKNNQKVELSPGKIVKVTMLNDNGEDDFKAYKMDESTAKWTYLEYSRCFPNPAYKKLSNFLDTVGIPAPPAEPHAHNPEKLIFDIDLRAYGHYSDFHGMLWQYEDTARATNPQLHPEIFEKHWDNFIIRDADSSNFSISFKINGDRYSFLAKPVLKGLLLKKEQGKYIAKIKELKAKIAEINKQKALLEQTLVFQRTLAINKMGIYNFDRQLKNVDAIPLLAEFKVNPSLHSSEDDFCIYLIVNKTDAVKYPKETWSNFRLNPNDHNLLLAVFGDGNTIFIKNKELVGYESKTKFVFEFKDHKVKINNPKELDELINNS